MKIEKVSNWGYWDALDGRRLKEGDQLLIRWANAPPSLHTVAIDHRTFEASEQGGSSTCPNDAAYVTLELPQGTARIYIRGCEAERVTDLSAMRVGTCAHCKLPVTEADSWTHDGPDMGGYPPTVAVYHSACKQAALLEAAEKEASAPSWKSTGAQSWACSCTLVGRVPGCDAPGEPKPDCPNCKGVGHP